MVDMATWQDGPEYAPIERPDDFAAPSIAPLDSPPPRAPLSAGAPLDRPEVEPPSAPVADLATLEAAVGEPPRDPHRPFEVVRAIMTDATSAWSAAHSASSSILTAPASPTWAPPSGAPVSTATLNRPPAPSHGLGSGERSILRPPPTQPIQITGSAYTVQGADFAGAERPPASVTFADLLASITPAVAICLLLGGFIAPISLLLFIVAFCLTVRLRVAVREIRYTFIGASVIIGLAAVVLVFAGNTLGSWWNTVGQVSVVLCWLVLLVSCVLLFRALQAGAVPPNRQPPMPQRNPWG